MERLIEILTDENSWKIFIVNCKKHSYDTGLTIGEIIKSLPHPAMARETLIETFSKLAAYEDTGLSPEEINELSHCNELSDLLDTIKKLTAERDKAAKDLKSLKGRINLCSICEFNDMLGCCHIKHCGQSNKYFKWRGLEGNYDETI